MVGEGQGCPVGAQNRGAGGRISDSLYEEQLSFHQSTGFGGSVVASMQLQLGRGAG